MFVLTFKGARRAQMVKELGMEIDAVHTVAWPGKDEVVLRLDSPGGTVTGYGLGGGGGAGRDAAPMTPAWRTSGISAGAQRGR